MKRFDFKGEQGGAHLQQVRVHMLQLAKRQNAIRYLLLLVIIGAACECSLSSAQNCTA